MKCMLNIFQKVAFKFKNMNVMFHQVVSLLIKFTKVNLLIGLFSVVQISLINNVFQTNPITDALNQNERKLQPIT